MNNLEIFYLSERIVLFSRKFFVPFVLLILPWTWTRKICLTYGSVLCLYVFQKKTTLRCLGAQLSTKKFIERLIRTPLAYVQKRLPVRFEMKILAKLNFIEGIIDPKTSMTSLSLPKLSYLVIVAQNNQVKKIPKNTVKKYLK